MVYNPVFWDNDWSCEDTLLARKSGLYTIHRLSFAYVFVLFVLNDGVIS